MTEEIRKKLDEAKEVYRSRNYHEAHDMYQTLFSENSEDFNQWDKIFYSWSIYQLNVKNFDDERQLLQSVELITDLTFQSDLKKSKTCAYTLSLFKVLDHLYRNKEYESVLHWLDKIDPTLLDSKPSEYNGVIYPSRLEKYYNYASKSYLECNDYENCILISDKALRTLSNFTNSSDAWFNWRIAKSLRALNKPEDALTYLNEVSKVKRDWFIPKEMAENYFMLDDKENALKYVADAILTDEPSSLKVNLYHLVYKILKDDEPDIALIHAKLVVALKLKNNVDVPHDLEELYIDDSELDIGELEDEIKKYWSERKFEGQQLQFGIISKILDHGKAGFIKSIYGNESFYFNVYEFKDDKSLLDEGLQVSFYKQKGFDRSKNQETTNAVNIHIVKL